MSDVPIYYVVSRTLSGEQVAAVVNALRITPIFCSVISQHADTELGFRLADEVIRVDSDEQAVQTALEVWKETQRPTAVIGTAGFLDAYYEEGRKEEVTCS